MNMTSIIFLGLVGLYSLCSWAIPAKLPQYPWPLEFKRGADQFSSNFGQYQWLGARYFHAGLDILAVPGQPLWSPTRGKIEGGFYEYKDSPHGHYYLKKQWLPLAEALRAQGPQTWSDFQFEVAIVTEEGYRLELHHVDPHTLPQDIRQAILQGQEIEAGVIVGFVKFLDVTEFGTNYTHIHYNVVSPEGIHLNPQAFSPSLPDTRAPQIHGVFAGPLRACNTGLGDVYKAISPNNPVTDERELLVRASDLLDGNRIAQAPTRFKAHFSGHKSYEVDFSYSLLGSDLQPLPVHDIYQREFCIDAGPERPFQMRGSTIQSFYFRVPIPPGFSGTAVLELGDFQGNWAKQSIEILGSPPRY